MQHAVRLVGLYNVANPTGTFSRPDLARPRTCQVQLVARKSSAGVAWLTVFAGLLLLVHPTVMVLSDLHLVRAHTAPSVYRLALLLGLVYTILVGLLALVLVALALDFCMSGKLRMVVILEQ